MTLGELRELLADVPDETDVRYRCYGGATYPVANCSLTVRRAADDAQRWTLVLS